MDPYADYPKQQILFFVVGDADAVTTQEMRRLITDLGSERQWSVAPPSFVDETDTSSMTSPDDLPVRTLGGVLELFSAWPPEGRRLPNELDRANLDDLKAVIAVLAPFSSKTGHEIEFELEGEPVGAIRGGELSRMLREGLLAEWERGLKERT